MLASWRLKKSKHVSRINVNKIQLLIKVVFDNVQVKGKAVPLRAWRGPDGSRKLRFPDFVTMAQDGGRLSALRTGRLYHPGNTPNVQVLFVNMGNTMRYQMSKVVML